VAAVTFRNNLMNDRSYVFLDRSSLFFGSGSNAGAVFVKFENSTNDVELINEDITPQRKSSFDNPTYEAVETLIQSRVR